MGSFKRCIAIGILSAFLTVDLTAMVPPSWALDRQCDLCDSYKLIPELKRLEDLAAKLDATEDQYFHNAQAMLGELQAFMARLSRAIKEQRGRWSFDSVKAISGGVGVIAVAGVGGVISSATPALGSSPTDVLLQANLKLTDINMNLSIDALNAVSNRVENRLRRNMSTNESVLFKKVKGRLKELVEENARLQYEFMSTLEKMEEIAKRLNRCFKCERRRIIPSPKDGSVMSSHSTNKVFHTISARASKKPACKGICDAIQGLYNYIDGRRYIFHQRRQLMAQAMQTQMIVNSIALDTIKLATRDRWSETLAGRIGNVLTTGLAVFTGVGGVVKYAMERFFDYLESSYVEPAIKDNVRLMREIQKQNLENQKEALFEWPYLAKGLDMELYKLTRYRYGECGEPCEEKEEAEGSGKAPPKIENIGVCGKKGGVLVGPPGWGVSPMGGKVSIGSLRDRGGELIRRSRGRVRIVGWMGSEEALDQACKGPSTKGVMVIIYEYPLERKLQGDQQKEIHPDDPFYSRRVSAARKVVRGLFKGLSMLQGIQQGEISIGGGGGGTADNQWGLWRIGFTPLDDPNSAWNAVVGRAVPIVAIIDSGLDIGHPDLPSDVLWINEDEIPGNFIDDDGNGYIDDTFGWNFVDWNNLPFDDNGHGTFVTGIIAAQTDNATGIAGINPKVKIMPLKVMDYAGRTNSLDVYRAILYAVDNGARVINLSLGGRGLSKLEQLAVEYAYERGVLVVVAAGNEGIELDDYGPSGLKKVFTVAALDIDGKRRKNSNYGLTVAITAPGEGIISLRARGTDFLRWMGNVGSATLGKDGLYYQATGTSFAAPFVTGVVSLLLARAPELSPPEIERILLDTATDIEEPGWDVKSGAGLLNASRALRAERGNLLDARITGVEKADKGRGNYEYRVYGVASGDAFKGYTLSIGKGKKPKEWKVIDQGDGEVLHGLLGVIKKEDLKGLKGWGRVKVRLEVEGADGKVKGVVLDLPKG